MFIYGFQGAIWRENLTCGFVKGNGDTISDYDYLTIQLFKYSWYSWHGWVKIKIFFFGGKGEVEGVGCWICGVSYGFYHFSFLPYYNVRDYLLITGAEELVAGYLTKIHVLNLVFFYVVSYLN